MKPIYSNLVPPRKPRPENRSVCVNQDGLDAQALLRCVEAVSGTAQTVDTRVVASVSRDKRSVGSHRFVGDS